MTQSVVGDVNIGNDNVRQVVYNDVQVAPRGTREDDLRQRTRILV